MNRPTIPPDTYERTSDAHALIYNAKLVLAEIEHIGMGLSRGHDARMIVDRMTAMARVAMDNTARGIEILTDVIDHSPEDAA